MRKEYLQILTKTSAANKRFRFTVSDATNMELRSAVTIMTGKPGNKARIAACDRELRIRGALKNESLD